MANANESAMNAANGGGAKIPPGGVKGRVMNNKEGFGQPGNKLPADKHDTGVANKAGFRSVAAGSMMRNP